MARSGSKVSLDINLSIFMVVLLNDKLGYNTYWICILTYYAHMLNHYVIRSYNAE